MNVRVDIATNAGQPLDAGADRVAALADARRRAQANQLESARVSQENQAQKLAESRDAVARAIGANTRLSIERSSQSDIFIYRAIDNTTGEIVREWPPQQFAEFVRDQQLGLSGDISTISTGTLVDEQA